MFMLSDAACKLATQPIRKRNLARLRIAVDGDVAISPSYPDIKIDLRSFDWKDRGYSRNWWWSMQQLPSVAWSAGDLDVLDSEFRKKIMLLNESLIGSWSRECRGKPSTVPLAWHDHASALRAIHLFRWTSSLFAAKCIETDIESNKKLILEHAHWLADSANYSMGNNHGFEQSWILLEIACDWQGVDELRQYEELACRRLRWEVEEAFTSDGVHIENSPEYQYFMLKRLRQLHKFLEARHMELIGLDCARLIKKSEHFLQSLVIPDGRFPLIGDTQNKPKYRDDLIRYHKQNKGEGDRKVDYSSSGYFIWRSSEREDSPGIHFIMKCAHDSQYHRHDDDLMVHLVVDGDVVFGDSGLYMHDGKCAVREYMRSPYAHSTVFPDGVTRSNRNPNRLRKRPNLIYKEKSFSVMGTTFLFDGLVLSRRCKMIGRRDRIMKISDIANNKHGEDRKMITSFILPWKVQVEVDDEEQIIRIPFTSERDIELERISGALDRVRIFRGWNGSAKNSAVTSELVGQLADATRLQIEWTARSNSKSKIELLVRFASTHDNLNSAR